MQTFAKRSPSNRGIPAPVGLGAPCFSTALRAALRELLYSFGQKSNGRAAIDVYRLPRLRVRVALRRLKLHGIRRRKVPEVQGLKKHPKSHSLAGKKSSRF